MCVCVVVVVVFYSVKAPCPGGFSNKRLNMSIAKHLACSE